MSNGLCNNTGFFISLLADMFIAQWNELELRDQPEGEAQYAPLLELIHPNG